MIYTMVPLAWMLDSKLWAGRTTFCRATLSPNGEKQEEVSNSERQWWLSAGVNLSKNSCNTGDSPLLICQPNLVFLVYIAWTVKGQKFFSANDFDSEQSELCFNYWQMATVWTMLSISCFVFCFPLVLSVILSLLLSFLS